MVPTVFSKKVRKVIPCVEKFAFDEKTDLWEVLRYLNELRNYIAQGKGIQVRVDAIKLLSGLNRSLVILKNARRSGFNPCVSCLNKQYCSTVSAFVSRKEPGYIDTGGCSKSEKCNISNRDIKEALKSIYSFIIILQEKSSRRRLLCRIDNLIFVVEQGM